MRGCAVTFVSRLMLWGRGMTSLGMVSWDESLENLHVIHYRDLEFAKIEVEMAL